MNEMGCSDCSEFFTCDYCLSYEDRMKEENCAQFKIVCECGAEKCRTTHADYCPKYNQRK